MPWFTAPISGATTGLDVFYQNVVDAFVKWRGQVNANNNNLANLNILQAREVRIMGIKVSPGTFVIYPCTATANPLVWTFLASSVQNVYAAIDGLPLMDQSLYNITGSDLIPSIINSGFESDFASWLTSGTCSIGTVNPQQGAKCAVLSSDNAYIEQLISGLPLGAGVQVSCYVRGDVGTTATVDFIVQNQVGGGVIDTTFTVTPFWTLISALFTADSLGTLGMAVKRNPGAGNLYFDSFNISGALLPTLRTITFVSGNQPIDDETLTIIGGAY